MRRCCELLSGITFTKSIKYAIQFDAVDLNQNYLPFFDSDDENLRDSNHAVIHITNNAEATPSNNIKSIFFVFCKQLV